MTRQGQTWFLKTLFVGIDFDFRFTCEEGFFDKMISGASRPIFRVGTKYWSEFKKKPFDVKKIDEKRT